jgi:multiple antibiotic resistance protein
VLLLVLAIYDLLHRGKPAVEESEMVGVVPLAMPLIAGPATLTTILVLAARYRLRAGRAEPGAEFAILLAGARVLQPDRPSHRPPRARALSKLVMVLLAAIAVNYIRVGITEVMRAARAV